MRIRRSTRASGKDCSNTPSTPRPREFMGVEVPEVLLSGNHEEIRRWRRKQSLRRTILRRPDLIERFRPGKEDSVLMREIMEELD